MSAAVLERPRTRRSGRGLPALVELHGRDGELDAAWYAPKPFEFTVRWDVPEGAPRVWVELVIVRDQFGVITRKTLAETWLDPADALEVHTPLPERW